MKKTKRIDTQLWLLHLKNHVCELDVRPGEALCIDLRGVFPSIAFENEEGHPGLEVLDTVTFTKHLGYLMEMNKIVGIS